MCQVCGTGFGLSDLGRGCQLEWRVVCPRCCGDLRPGAFRSLDGLSLRSAYQHSGAAARLVWALKYQGQIEVGRFLAKAMVDRLPSNASVLVPVPRLLTRRLRYGVDPAVVLAVALSRQTSIPVVNALAAPLVGKRRAGLPREQRAVPGFWQKRTVANAVLVDDVVTTGRTLEKAAKVLTNSSVLAGVTATGAL